MTEDTSSAESQRDVENKDNMFTRFIVGLLRIVLIAAFLGLLGVLIFYGLPQLYIRTVLPLQNEMRSLGDTQYNQKQEIHNLSQEVGDIETRLNDIEIKQDSINQDIDEIANRLESLLSSQEALDENITNIQAENQVNIDDLSSSLDELERILNQINKTMKNTDEDITEMQNELDVLQERLDNGDVPVVELRRELQMVKAMELLTRSRLFLVENNLGLAEDDLLTAHQLIINLDVEDHQLEAKSAVIIHLELALDNLPSSPIIAAENLELAWQLLKNGLPDRSSTEESVTITPDSGNVQVTPTITPTFTVTPTTNP